MHASNHHPSHTNPKTTHRADCCSDCSSSSLRKEGETKRTDLIEEQILNNLLAQNNKQTKNRNNHQTGTKAADITAIYPSPSSIARIYSTHINPSVAMVRSVVVHHRNVLLALPNGVTGDLTGRPPRAGADPGAGVRACDKPDFSENPTGGAKVHSHIYIKCAPCAHINTEGCEGWRTCESFMENNIYTFAPYAYIYST